MLLLLTVGAAAQTSRRALTRDLGRTGSNYFTLEYPVFQVQAPDGKQPRGSRAVKSFIPAGTARRTYCSASGGCRARC